MESPRVQRDLAEMESYVYFDAHIRKLPKRADGGIDTSAVGFVDNDVDAFRHAYVSGRFLHLYSERFALLLGWLNEIWFPSSPSGKNMDLWNSSVGRELAKKHRTKEGLAEAIREALDFGRLITRPGDNREYTGASTIKPTEDFSVVVIKKAKNGTNDIYYDVYKETFLTKQEFITAIQAGKYPAYSVRTINQRMYPVANRNKLKSDNLG
jgi:hypothetical protein